MENKEIIKKAFTDWTMEELEDTFNLIETEENENLNKWINADIEITDFEKKMLEKSKNRVKKYVRHWNESELSFGFISLLINLADYNNDDFRFFSERNISGIINNYEISGKPDGIIATGKWSPKQPFFFMSEYKREQNSKAWPDAQNLVAMLVAQKLNDKKFPVYGIYIVGRSWYFMVLENKNYSISNLYDSITDDIFDIFKILKQLKIIITEQSKQLKNK